uniref:Nuclear receptor domain-containing protein n=1 Tax=Meloidogyne incognita TaxID=6306 RepID=A0A914M2E6_MELIC
MEENNNFQQNLNYPISNQNIKGNENKKLITKKAFPINCRVCGGVASGYIYYGVMCCDGCKHFFRRCIATKDEIKCKSEGNCEIMNVPNKCKSCRFDKCILKGMNVEKLKGPHNKSIWDVRSLIEQRIGELALNGKYVERKIENYVNINLNAVFSVMQNNLIENQDSQIIDYLLLIEHNVQRIRISPTKVIDKHYNYSCKTLNDLINQQENLISKSCEYLDEEMKMPDTDYFEFLNKNGLFAIHPHSLIEDLMLIVNMAKIMPFFNKLEMSDIVNQLKNISWAIIVLAVAYYSSTKLSDAVITTERLPMYAAFSGDYYKGNLTLSI